MNNTELTTEAVPEAPLADTGHGLEPQTPGWYVLNVRDAAGWSSTHRGYGVAFESPSNQFEQYGLNVHVLEPGQASCRYHFEPAQEDFLVLAGECLAIVEDQERTLHPGDLLHCPPFTKHVFVGAGNGPCAILMIGTRMTFDGGGYPPSETAARHGASVATFTPDPEVAYAGDPPVEPARVDLSWVFPTTG